MPNSIIQPRTLRGFNDLMPAAARRRRRMLGIVEETFDSFGFDPIDTPAVEYAEILKGKGGGESDKQMFEFDDQGERRVALRFDLTVPLARFVAQHGPKLTFPLRVYHLAPVWRGERPQRGRFREFIQCDADIVGETGEAADAEMLVLAQTTLRRLEVGEVHVRINHRGVLNGFLDDLDVGDRVLPVLRALDKIDKIGADGVAAELRELGLGDETVQRILELIGARQATTAETLDAVAELVPAGGAAAAGLAAVRRTIDLAVAAGGDADGLRFDPSIVRGLDYYTGMVYELQLVAMPEIGSIGAGGRYDNLVGLYSTNRYPGVGGTIGISRIMSALADREDAGSGRDRTLVVVTHDGGHGPAELAAGIRRDGAFDVDLYPALAKHAAQMKYADRRGARFVLTLDADDLVSVKDMTTGERRSCPAAEVPALLRKLA